MNLPIKIVSNIDVVFKTISHQNLNDKEAIRMSINNSIIEHCSFNNINMKHCDILSTKICNSTFNKVDLRNTDLLSLWISDCQFIEVDFSGADIEDITFSNCSFQDCVFKNVELKRCYFSNTKFINITPDSSSFVLNNYTNCYFQNCNFKNSFHYQIFGDCKFQNVVLDYNILKYNYGIDVNSEITFMDKDKIQNSEQLYNLLKTECIEQQLYINSVLIDYNFQDKINPILVLNSIKAIGCMIENDILIRNNELHFLRNLYHHLYAEEIIAPIILYKLFKTLQEIYMKWRSCKSNISFAKCKDELYMISNSLYFDFSDFCEQLKKKISPITGCTYPIFIDIHYNDEPEKEISTILNKYQPGTFYRISTKKGSFWEYLEVGQNGLEIFKMFIQLLGIAAPIIYAEYKEKRKDKLSKVTAHEHVETENSNMKNQSDISGLIKQACESINSSDILTKNQPDVTELMQQTCELINSSDILTENQSGYNKDNIQQIYVKYYT